MKWEQVELGDTATFVNGFPFKPTDWSTTGKEIIRIQNLTKSNGLEANRYDGTIHERYLVKKGDLLISWSGTLGIYEWNGDEAWLNQHIFKVVFDKAEVNKKYFKFLIQSKLHELELQVHGATMKHITKGKFDALRVPLPPLHIQEQIADTLDKADALRRKDQELLQKYDQLAQSIFYDMFGDPVRNDKGWEVKKLGDLCNIKRGASPRPIDKFIGHEVPWIKIGDATKGDDMFITKTKVHITKEGSKKSILVRPDDLIFANCGVSLGFARISKITGCIHDGWLAIEIKNTDNLNQVFLLKLINALTIYLRGLAPEGTQPNLNIGIMKTLEIIVPPITLQRSFNDLNKQFYLSKINIESEIKKSYSLFDNISNLVFS